MSLSAKQRAFLAAYARTGTVVKACKVAKLDRNNHYNNWQGKPEYDAAFAAAREEATQRLEAEVIRRAYHGDREMVLYQGEPVMEPLYDKDGEVLRDGRGRIRYSNKPLFVNRRSDVLLMFTLKALKPEKYRENSQVALTGAGGAPLEIQVRFVSPSTQQA